MQTGIQVVEAAVIRGHLHMSRACHGILKRHILPVCNCSEHHAGCDVIVSISDMVDEEPWPRMGTLQAVSRSPSFRLIERGLKRPATVASHNPTHGHAVTREDAYTRIHTGAMCAVRLLVCSCGLALPWTKSIRIDDFVYSPE